MLTECYHSAPASQYPPARPHAASVTCTSDKYDRPAAAPGAVPETPARHQTKRCACVDPCHRACDNRRMPAAVNARPSLWVRARIDPSLIDEFEAWYTATHLPHILSIPGIVRAQRVRGAQDPAGAHLMMFEFADEAAVQPALASQEAQRARRDWERWRPHLQELSVEIYAPLAPIDSYHHRN